MIRNFNGITVKELKDFVKDLPERDEERDEDYTVWVGNDEGTSNACKSIWHLNKDENGSDIILEI